MSGSGWKSRLANLRPLQTARNFVQCCTLRAGVALGQPGSAFNSTNNPLTNQVPTQNGNRPARAPEKSPGSSHDFSAACALTSRPPKGARLAAAVNTRAALLVRLFFPHGLKC